MIAIACDHGGFSLKAEIIRHLKSKGFELRDFGSYDDTSCDYTDYAHTACAAVQTGECDFAILICGTGIGMSIAANKLRGIRAALCGDCFSAMATREHNDANVLCLGARVIGPSLALMIVDTFLSTPFSNAPRHVRRISKIE